jgi:transcriptional regulator with XRE-family HTH domain
VSGNELGLFLRSRREAVTPAEVGLPSGPRRRTSGLRRAEVAMLAGVSVEYVIRLEQGRDRRPSPAVLSALADALRLGASDRVHLYRLTKAADAGFTCRNGTDPGRVVRAGVRRLLDSLEPGRAALVNDLGEVLACTTGYRELAEPVGLLDGTPPSLVRFVFTDPRARAAYPDWEQVADEQVAALKQGPFRADPHIAALVDELTVTAGEPFAERLDRVPGPGRSHGVTRLLHPGAGELRLAYETLDLPGDDQQRLVLHLPADAATAAALDGLTRARQPGLRLVSGG